MPAQLQVSGAALHRFVTYRKAAGERLYAVVDAARDQALATAPRDEFNLPSYSLFDGDAPDFMHDVAPYLFSFDLRPTYPYRASALLDRFAARLGTSAGILVLSEANSRDMVLHLRNVFRITTNDRRAYYFRFYDPRVLRAFLPGCTPDDAARFFGPIRRVIVEADRSGVVLSFAPDRPALKTEEVELTTQPGA